MSSQPAIPLRRRADGEELYSLVQQKWEVSCGWRFLVQKAIFFRKKIHVESMKEPKKTFINVLYVLLYNYLLFKIDLRARTKSCETSFGKRYIVFEDFRVKLPSALELAFFIHTAASSLRRSPSEPNAPKDGGGKKR